MEYSSKEKFEREKLELEHKLQQLKMDTDSLKNEYYQKLGDVEYQKKMINEEKLFFERYKDEAMKNIDLKRGNMEDMKKKFHEEEREMNARRKVLQEQDFYLKEKFEEFEKLKREIAGDQARLEGDKKELLVNVAKFKEQLKSYEEKSLILEKEKEQIFKRYQDLESERVFISNEKLKIEQGKTELRLRMQSMDALRIKYVASSTDNLGLAPNMTGNNFAKTGFQTGFPDKGVMSNNFISTKTENLLKVNNDVLNKTNMSLRKSFNCDEYLSSLRMKLGNNTISAGKPNNFTDYIFQEKEYLKKSVTDNGPEKDFDFEIKKELDRINNKNTSLLMQNEVYQGAFDQHKSSYGNYNYFNKAYEDKQTFEKHYEMPSHNNYKEEKPDFGITDGKQFFSGCVKTDKEVVIHTQPPLMEKAESSNNLMNKSDNSNSQKKSDKTINEKPPSMTPTLHYNNVNLNKVNESNNKSRQEEALKKSVIDDDEFDI